MYNSVAPSTMQSHPTCQTLVSSAVGKQLPVVGLPPPTRCMYIRPPKHTWGSSTNVQELHHCFPLPLVHILLGPFPPCLTGPCPSTGGRGGALPKEAPTLPQKAPIHRSVWKGVAWQWGGTRTPVANKRSSVPSSQQDGKMAAGGALVAGHGGVPTVRQRHAHVLTPC